MRAAARGLLDFDDGCPLTKRYFAKEAWILQEIVRQDHVRLNESMAHIQAAKSQLVARGPLDTLWWSLYDYAGSESLLSYQRMGKLMFPWDDSWTTALKATQSRLYEQLNEVGGTGLSDKSIVGMINEYEAARADWKSRHEPSRPEST